MSIISTILGVESGGGRNLTQGNIGDINNVTGDLAQGYFQITGGTWRDFGGGTTGYNSAIQAPYGTQLGIAQNIPVARWGPNTQAALITAGYSPKPGETLGQMLARYGEDPTATTPIDGASAADGGMAHAFDSSTGLPAGVTDVPDAMNSDPMTGKSGSGQQISVGLQKSLVGDIEKWISGVAKGVWESVWQTVSASFLNVQNWFIRAFVIIVGLVILAIGLIKLSGNDPTELAIKVAKAAA